MNTSFITSRPVLELSSNCPHTVLIQSSQSSDRPLCPWSAGEHLIHHQQPVLELSSYSPHSHQTVLSVRGQLVNTSFITSSRSSNCLQSSQSSDRPLSPWSAGKHFIHHQHPVLERSSYSPHTVLTVLSVRGQLVNTSFITSSRSSNGGRSQRSRSKLRSATRSLMLSKWRQQRSPLSAESGRPAAVRTVRIGSPGPAADGGRVRRSSRVGRRQVPLVAAGGGRGRTGRPRNNCPTEHGVIQTNRTELLYVCNYDKNKSVFFRYTL